MTASRCKKINDIAREYAIQAQRREAKARAFEEQGRAVAARESYMIAAMLWSIARWPIFEMNDELEHLEKKMNECYAKYITYAAHPIERVEIPFGNGQFLPAYLHLPHKPAPGEKFPCIIAVGGMDGTKENACAMYGDKLLERGIAIFAVDGPGQGECFARRVLVTHTVAYGSGRGELQIRLQPSGDRQEQDRAARLVHGHVLLDPGRIRARQAHHRAVAIGRLPRARPRHDLQSRRRRRSKCVSCIWPASRTKTPSTNG